MSNTSNIVVTLSSEVSGSGASDWIRLIQLGLDDGGTTHTELASVINSVFNSESCNGGAEAAQQDIPVQEPISEDDFNSLITESFDMRFCDRLPDNGYEVKVRVVRSDCSKPYVLRLTNGSVLSTLTVIEEVVETLLFEESDSVKLSYPTDNVSITWGGLPIDSNGHQIQIPVISLNLDKIEVPEKISGSITVSYAYTSDIVTIQVYGTQADCHWDTSWDDPTLPGFTLVYENPNGTGCDEREVPGCLVVAFYEKTIDELEIRPPDVDDDPYDPEQMWYYCNPHQDQIVFAEPTGEHICYETVKYRVLNSCDDSDVLDEVEQDERIDCWKNFGSCWRDSGCYHFKGSRTQIWDYQFSPSGPSGGSIDYYERLDDPNTYKNYCCKEWPFSAPMPRCHRIKIKNSGNRSITEEDKEFQRGIYGSNTVFIPVTPKNGDCGYTEVIQDVVKRNCCDTITVRLGINEDESVEVINPDSHGNIYVITDDTVESMYYSITGTGFWLDPNHSITSMTSENRRTVIPIYTSNDACGGGVFTVSDGCDTVQHRLRTTVGSWRVKDGHDFGPPYLLHSIRTSGNDRFQVKTRLPSNYLTSSNCLDSYNSPGRYGVLDCDDEFWVSGTKAEYDYMMSVLDSEGFHLAVTGTPVISCPSGVGHSQYITNCNGCVLSIVGGNEPGGGDEVTIDLHWCSVYCTQEVMDTLHDHDDVLLRGFWDQKWTCFNFWLRERFEC